MVYKVAKTQSFQSILVMKMKIIKQKIQVYFVLRGTQTFRTIEHHRNLESKV